MKKLNQVFLGLFVAGLFSIGGYSNTNGTVNAQGTAVSNASAVSGSVKIYCDPSWSSCRITLPGGGGMEGEGNPTWEY